MPIEILQYPDSRLKNKAQIVTEFTESLQAIIDDMFETLYHTKNCAGLAATQLAIAPPPPKITVIYDYRKGDKPSKDQSLCLINPEVIAKEGELLEPEACMSVPGGIYESVPRPAKVVVRALDRKGEAFEIEGEGYMAKLLQHEIDHLNGLIFIDHLSRFKRQRVDKKIAKHRKWHKK
jgi:peptide deformylase